MTGMIAPPTFAAITVPGQLTTTGNDVLIRNIARRVGKVPYHANDFCIISDKSQYLFCSRTLDTAETSCDL
jgi:hypothetical protein